MSQSINLIPKEEQVLQKKSQVVKFSTVLSILLLVIVAGVAAFYFYTASNIDAQLKAENARTAGLRSDIGKLSTIEITARNLDKKYSMLEKIIAERQRFSLALKDLEIRTPENIKVDDLSLNADSTLAAAGLGEDYLSISDFVNLLTEDGDIETTKSEKYSELHGKKVFKEVALNSVSLDAQNKSVKYFIVISYLKDVLTK